MPDNRLCEEQDGICYFAFDDLHAAQTEVAKMNRDAISAGHMSRYSIECAPSGMLFPCGFWTGTLPTTST
jgi:hypothetical protein